MNVRTVVYSLFAVFLCLGWSGSTIAEEDHNILEFDPAVFAEQRAKLQRSLGSTRYTELTPDNRERVVQALERMHRNLDGVTSIDDLDARTKVAVFNDQELINQILTQAAADSRLVCTREKPTGSHRWNTICMTAAQRAEAQEKARLSLGKRRTRLCDPANPAACNQGRLGGG